MYLKKKMYICKVIWIKSKKILPNGGYVGIRQQISPAGKNKFPFCKYIRVDWVSIFILLVPFSTPRGKWKIFSKAGRPAYSCWLLLTGASQRVWRRGHSCRWHRENCRRHLAFRRKALAPPTKISPGFLLRCCLAPLSPRNFCSKLEIRFLIW